MLTTYPNHTRKAGPHPCCPLPAPVDAAALAAALAAAAGDIQKGHESMGLHQVLLLAEFAGLVG